MRESLVLTVCLIALLALMTALAYVTLGDLVVP